VENDQRNHQKTVEIVTAAHPQEFCDAKLLIMDYVAWLGMDLSFQDFDREMETLPDLYNTERGGLFIAYLNGQPVGVAGLRKFGENDGEVKRMFVKPEARTRGIGRLLLAKCIETAQQLHYISLKLDTSDEMKTAINLYEKMGFVEIPAYRFNPHESARYFALDLTSRS
jgi:putative acetyltransferase